MKRSVVRALAAGAVCAAAVTAVAGAATATQFYVPKPDKGALAQVSDLLSQQDKTDANLIREMTGESHAVWFTGGTPAEVQRQVNKTVNAAAGQHSVAVLVAYDVPFRDCGQYSAGGALNTADYLAWIDAFRPRDRLEQGRGASGARRARDHSVQHRHQRQRRMVPARPVRYRSGAGDGQSARGTTRSAAQSRGSSSNRT